MRPNPRMIIAGLIAVFLAVAIAACGGSSHPHTQEKETNNNVETERESFGKSYVPHNHVDFTNFNGAQELYDSPSTIVWCTTTWDNPSAPMVTVPIAGKLTSSSVSYRPQDKVIETGNEGAVVVENTSNDGMYHGSPPPYRYGFTPGHQYVDFFNMATFCTTALTEFQRQQTEVTIAVNQKANKATEKAEEALEAGFNPETKKISHAASAEAQKILQEANLNGSK